MEIDQQQELQQQEEEDQDQDQDQEYQQQTPSPQPFQSPGSPQSQGDFKLMDAKQLRKKAEEDAQLLANRIALLEIEEKKANKKIKETKKKANEILSLKNRNQEHKKLKEEYKEYQQEMLRRKAEYNLQNKTMTKMNMHTSKMIYDNKVRSDAEMMKRIKQQTKEINLQQKEEDYVKNTTVAQSQRNKEKELEVRKLQQKEQKILESKKDYEERIGRELRMKQERELQIQMLEQREMELIQKLQKTQNQQKLAFSELEQVISCTPQDIQQINGEQQSSNRGNKSTNNKGYSSSKKITNMQSYTVNSFGKKN